MKTTRFVTTLALLALTWAMSTGMLGACNLFEPERAEPPVSSSSIREDFSSPESTLATVSRAFAAKTSGLNTYSDCIASLGRDGLAFTAVFDPAVTQAYDRTPSEWDESYEQVFYSDFVDKFNGRDSLSFRVIPEQPDPDFDPSQPDRLVLNRHYEAWDVVNQTDGVIIHRRRAVGNATLTFARVAGQWRILIWNDKVDPGVGVNPVEADDRTFSWRRLEATGGS